MKRFTVAIVALSGCILGPACQAIVGIDDRSEAPVDGVGVGVGVDASLDGTSSPSNDAGTDARPPDLDPDAAPPLGCPASCLPRAPIGWTGPSATYDAAESGKPKDCPADYTVKEVDSYGEMMAASATCDCGTGVNTGSKCTAGVSTYPQASCGGTGTKLGTASNDQCFVTSDDQNITYRVSTPTVVAGSCSFPNAKTTRPAPTFTSVQLACGLGQPVECPMRPECVSTPAPAQPFTRLCIHKDGEVSCPSQDYKSRFVAYKTIDDKRVCSTCAATPTGGACDVLWGNRASVSQCVPGLFPTDKTAGSCYTYGGSGTVIDLTGMGNGAGTCTATSTPSGIASQVDPVTFCCNQ